MTVRNSSVTSAALLLARVTSLRGRKRCAATPPRRYSAAPFRGCERRAVCRAVIGHHDRCVVALLHCLSAAPPAMAPTTAATFAMRLCRYSVASFFASSSAAVLLLRRVVCRVVLGHCAVAPLRRRSRSRAACCISIAGCSALGHQARFRAVRSQTGVLGLFVRPGKPACPFCRATNRCICPALSLRATFRRLVMEVVSSPLNMQLIYLVF